MSKSNEDAALGCLLGLAVGDALGTTLEFSVRDASLPLKSMVGGGPFNLSPGEWTDDTSMALCLAESLLACHRHDPIDQLSRYIRWRDRGENTVNGHCFDIGLTVNEALNRYQKTKNPYPGSNNERSAGNGSLMRLAPVVLFYCQSMFKNAVEKRQNLLHMAALSSCTTHAEARTISACQVMALLIAKAIESRPEQNNLQVIKNEVLSLNQDELDALGVLPREITSIVQGSYRHKQRHEILSSGFVVDSLEAALWSFWHSHSFEEGALLAANLAGDADTIAAIYGQLAGAFYGVAAIPSKWLEQLAWREKIAALAIALYDKETPRLPQNEVFLSFVTEMDQIARNDIEAQATRLWDLSYSLEIIQVFDWGSWLPAKELKQAISNNEIVLAGEIVQSWSLLDCCYMFTVIIRGSRYSGLTGTDVLVDYICNGLVPLLLQRIKQSSQPVIL